MAPSPASGFAWGSAASPATGISPNTDIIVKPADATKVSDAIVRVFIDLGDRTNRNKARLKYVLDGMGHDKFLALVEERLGHPFTRVPPEALAPRPAFDRMAHIGVHKQKQEGLELDRRLVAARQGHLRSDARARQESRRISATAISG